MRVEEERREGGGLAGCPEGLFGDLPVWFGTSLECSEPERGLYPRSHGGGESACLLLLLARLLARRMDADTRLSERTRFIKTHCPLPPPDHHQKPAVTICMSVAFLNWALGYYYIRDDYTKNEKPFFFDKLVSISV